MRKEIKQQESVFFSSQFSTTKCLQISSFGAPYNMVPKKLTFFLLLICVPMKKLYVHNVHDKHWFATYNLNLQRLCTMSV